MLKHFGGFVVGIFVGVLVIAVALVGGGYLLLTKDGMMKTVEESVGSSVGMDLSEEQEALSILDYGKGLLGIFANLSTTPIKDIEGQVGINKISTTISDAIGISSEVIGESSISNLGSTITNNLTMTVMKDKFEIELPDLPLFQDEEFLASPVSEAFGDLDQKTLDQFIEVVYEGEGTTEKPESSALIKKLGKVAIGEMSEDMDGIIQETTIGEIIDIDPSTSASVLTYLANTQIQDLDEDIKNMKLKDAIEIHTEDDPANGIKKSSKVMIYLANCTLEGEENGINAAIEKMTIGDAIDIYEEDDPENGITKSNKVLIYLADKQLDELDKAVNDMHIYDMVDTDNAHPVIKAIEGLTLKQLGDKGELQLRINTLKLGDVVTVDDNAPAILKALQDTPIGDLSTKMNNLTLVEVMDHPDVGVLSLIDPNTKIQELGTASSSAVTGSSLYALLQAGIFNYTTNDNHNFAEVVARINKNNSTPDAIISDFTGGGAGSVALDESITHSIYLKDTATVQNDTYHATFLLQPGHEDVEIALSDYLTKNERDAYVLTPQVIEQIMTVAGIGGDSAVVFYVDKGVNLEIQAGQTETAGVYDNYNKAFSILYDANNVEDQGTLYIGKGVRNEVEVGGCVVYVADYIKVLDASDNYVDYDLTQPLPITYRKVARLETVGTEEVKIESDNVWAKAYTSYDA